MKQTSLFEWPGIRKVTGRTVRPGGLDLTQRAVAWCGFPSGIRILDLGCGPGGTLDHLRTAHGFRAVGLDRSSLLLSEARAQGPDLPLVQADALFSPFRDRCLEAVLSECVLSVTLDPGEVLAECRRILRPKGRLIISDMYLRGLPPFPGPAPPNLNCCLQGARSGEDIRRLIRGAGFEVELWEDHSILLKHLAGRLVFEYGSLKAFWEAAAGTGDAGPGDLPGGHGKNRPGYFLMIATRKD